MEAGCIHTHTHRNWEWHLAQGDNGPITKQPEPWWGTQHTHYETGCYMSIVSGSLFSCVKMSRKLNWSLGGSADISAEMANSLSTIIWVTERTGNTSPSPSNNGDLVTKCSDPWTHCLSVEYHHANNENICLIPHWLSSRDWLLPSPGSLILSFYSRNIFVEHPFYVPSAEDTRVSSIFCTSTTPDFTTLEFSKPRGLCCCVHVCTCMQGQNPHTIAQVHLPMCWH